MASEPITYLLPEDVVLDILARLPVKSLKRFRCVGKSWCSLIQSPHFISAHYSFSRSKKAGLFLIRNEMHRWARLRWGKRNFLSIISSQTLDIAAGIDVPSVADWLTAKCMGGFCNGIICLWCHAGHVLLWNIATKEFKTLPICPVELLPDINNKIELVGLGYDSKRDEYKVIRVDSFWGDINSNQYDPTRALRDTRVALYNLSTDSWRKWNGDLSNCHFLGGHSFYSSGFYHYFRALVEDENVLLSFDMSSEVFVTTPFPLAFFHKETVRRLHGSYTADVIKNNFMEINGSVGRVVYNDFCEIDVWVLGEIGVKDSWMKLYKVGPVPCGLLPLGEGSDGKIFFVHETSGDLLVWNHLSNREVKTLPMIRAKKFSLERAMYAESLVSLMG